MKGPSEDGITSSKDFDLKFLFAQREALQLERIKLVGQANRLENEANAMIADAEMGDVKFDDEGGEGDTMVVEREQDLVLSAAARQTVEEIDAALARMKTGEYGYSERLSESESTAETVYGNSNALKGSINGIKPTVIGLIERWKVLVFCLLFSWPYILFFLE